MNKYLVWCPDIGETADEVRIIEATDAEEAAKAWAEHEDCTSADYWIANGDTATVIVRNIDIGVDTKFSVTGEMVAHYSAEEAK